MEKFWQVGQGRLNAAHVFQILAFVGSRHCKQASQLSFCRVIHERTGQESTFGNTEIGCPGSAATAVAIVAYCDCRSQNLLDISSLQRHPQVKRVGLCLAGCCVCCVGSPKPIEYDLNIYDDLAFSS